MFTTLIVSISVIGVYLGYDAFKGAVDTKAKVAAGILAGLAAINVVNAVLVFIG